MSDHRPYPDDPEDGALAKAPFNLVKHMQIPELLDREFGPRCLAALASGKSVMIYRYPVTVKPTASQMTNLEDSIHNGLADAMPALIADELQQHHEDVIMPYLRGMTDEMREKVINPYLAEYIPRYMKVVLRYTVISAAVTTAVIELGVHLLRYFLA